MNPVKSNINKPISGKLEERSMVVQAIMIEAVTQKCYVKEVFQNCRRFRRLLFFDKVVAPQTATLIKMRFRNMCFFIKLTKFLRTPVLPKICGRLFL